jgi:hypothetical protein
LGQNFNFLKFFFFFFWENLGAWGGPGPPKPQGGSAPGNLDIDTRG